MKSGVASCIFCKIVSGAIQSTKIHEDDRFICIEDLHPQAERHFLVIPKEHVVSLETAFPNEGTDQEELVGALMRVGTQVARRQGLLPDGFRAVINTNRNGGQTVYHLHLHILGGEVLRGTFA